MNLSTVKHQWDRAVAIAAALVGIALLVIGWVQVSSTAVVAEQIPYLASQCVGGLIAFGFATTLWICADLRDEWAKLDDIYQALDGRGSLRTAEGAGSVADDEHIRNAATMHRRGPQVTSAMAMEGPVR